jgi:hypothetical protein
MRRAIGLIQAIMMLLLVGGMMLLVLKYASISAKHVENSFVREQSELFLNSTIEQTLLNIAFNDRSTKHCLGSFAPKSVTKRGITYSADVNITRYYLQEGSDDLNDCSTLGIGIKESSDISHGMALLEVEVNATKADGTLVCRILRRTLQQP